MDTQPEVGDAAYDGGTAIVEEFFRKCLADFCDEPDLAPLGRRIVNCRFDGGSLEYCEALIRRGSDTGG